MTEFLHDGLRVCDSCQLGSHFANPRSYRRAGYLEAPALWKLQTNPCYEGTSKNIKCTVGSYHLSSRSGVYAEEDRGVLYAALL